jgi:hypothetical protein
MEILLEMLDQAFVRKAWHGPNLRGSLRGVDSAQALWRPSPGRHCIWEIAVHAAYWKYAVRRKINGEKRGTFALSGSNWLAPPVPAGTKEWRQALKLLDTEHKLLRESVSRFAPSKLGRKAAGSSYTLASLIYGVAFHDVYHAGQVQLLKRLHRGTTTKPA